MDANPTPTHLSATFRRHPLRIIGRSVWLCGEFIVMALDYCWTVMLRRQTSLPARARWLQQSSRRLLRVLNVDWRAVGNIPQRGLLVANHLSYLDITVLSAITPATFVAKREVKGWPLFGWFARMAGTIFVHREMRSDVGRTTAEIQEALDEGTLVVLFPEGTSSGGKTVLPFKSALLEPAVQSEHPLFAGCFGYALADGSVPDEVCYWGDMTLLPHLLNVIGKRQIAAQVAFARIAESGHDRKQLALLLHSEVLRLKESHPVKQP
jgi:1-acyl-sn-glycerol-3-phosphate acyltransferase